MKRDAHLSRRKRTLLCVLIGFLAFLLVVVGTLAVFVNVTLNKI